MLNKLKNKFLRLSHKSKWVSRVSSIGATPTTRLLLKGFGFVVLLSDPLSIKLNYPFKLKINNQTVPFIPHSIIDFGLMMEILVSDAYQLKNHSSESVKSIIDLGSNSGVSSLYFRSLFPNAQIYSCEPNPKVFVQLKQNAFHIGKIVPHQVLISDYNGESDFYYDKKSSVSSSLINRGTGTVALKLPCITLSEYLNQIRETKIDILKFDVEGSEELIFRNFKEYDRIETIIGELHYDLCDADGVCKTLSDNYPYVKVTWYSKQRAYIMASKNPIFKLISDQSDF